MTATINLKNMLEFFALFFTVDLKFENGNSTELLHDNSHFQWHCDFFKFLNFFWKLFLEFFWNFFGIFLIAWQTDYLNLITAFRWSVSTRFK